jgi:hypothetical protein
MMMDGPPRGRGPYGPPRDFGGPPRGPMMGPPRDMGPPRMAEPEIVIDREKTCPLLLRVFYKNGGHHKLEEFAVGCMHAHHALQHAWQCQCAACCPAWPLVHGLRLHGRMPCTRPARTVL